MWDQYPSLGTIITSDKRFAVKSHHSTTPQPQREIQHEREFEIAEPISRVEAIIETTDVSPTVEPSKKRKKIDRSSRR